VESVKNAKRTRQIGTDDCERSDRPPEQTPQERLYVLKTRLSKTILAIGVLLQDLCLSYGAFVRIIQGLGCQKSCGRYVPQAVSEQQKA
jgi:hypothetical protein